MRRTALFASFALAAGLLVVTGATRAADQAPTVAPKPDTHNGAWLQNHGRAARADEQSCLQCHSDRTSCIQCHQDTEPRSHTPAFVKRTHGLEARWSRESCLVCHKEDSCVSCHQTDRPSTHRPGWYSTPTGSGGGQHCLSCHYPVSDTTCFTCHKVAHAPGVFPPPTENLLRRR